ncbi:Putative GDP/GTP exchange factors [Komagataella phaffii CBS 7435]|uniref:GDP/GTP exchange factor required for mitotic exit at low temperatures n=2 Tax=Komagataella phaffii TaxID=460519 RepID=C4R5H2_KOMPG|nr:uncharacterized protein PAS_chr3_0758 [Komagataella phaffii GS115]AOA63779.1 GQ67_03855T0 [Komagataella phaffii]CAH2449408.1 Putative GDP/GTP exchange factors [Komagataella phaffii CBS 7435]CAY70808.1 Putative GDP/GTP exchange factor required for mitotic exit at low temperatures [Komagataella phaffii GS115]CCA39397.1 Putative GDP/GTP exchange factors [Komagataella phaffii CBS 7435]
MSANQAIDPEVFDDPVYCPIPTRDSVIRYQNTNDRRSTFESKADGSKQQPSDSSMMIACNVRALIVQLTSPTKIDYSFMFDFFFTYRLYLEPDFLMNLLLARLEWCLKGGNNVSVRRLALIRTFVCLRHWLLNYFLDDFTDNTKIRASFVACINRFASDSSYRKDQLISKILVDLKKIYIKLCEIYWSTLPLEKLVNVELINYNLSTYENLNSSRLSLVGLQHVHNPALRRSEIVSLNERNSLSSTNLLLQQLDSKVSNSFLPNNRTTSFHLSSKPASVVLRTARPRHPHHQLKPKDSLISLSTGIKSTNANQEASMSFPENEHIKRLSKVDDYNKENTNILEGGISMFKDAKVSYIVPSTPLKKMNIEIRQRSSPQVSPIKRKPTLSNKNPKKGLFGLHWRNKTLPTSAIPPERKSKFQVINQPSADLGEKTKVSLPTEKLDILGQRVIEEFNILLTKKELRNRIAKYSLLEQKQSKRRSNLSILNAFEKHCSKRDSESIIHEVNTTINADELLLAFNNKNDNRTSANLDNEASFNEGVVNMDLNLSKRSSFRSPSVTLNWSHSMNMTIDMDYEPIQDGKIPNPPEVLPDLLSDNMDNSGDLAEEDFHSTKSHISFTEDEVLSSSMLEKLQEDSRHMTPQPEQKNEKNQEEEPVLLPVSELDFKPCTDIPQVDDSFAMEAQKLTSSLQINSPTNTAGVTGTISQQGEELVFSLEPLHQTISYQSFNNRFSIRNISRESCSTHKSYVTYDSDLSHIDISGSVEYDSFGYKSLKKKTGFSSLRIGVLNEQLLRELPFYEQPDEQACQECAPVSGEVLSSDDELTPTMILEHQRPRSRLLQLFQEDLSVTKKETRESGVQPESSPKSSNVSMISSVSSSSFVLPYPGLSTTAIAELAAIPDDAGLEDPIQAALNKLEANDKEEAMSLYGLNDEVEHFNNQPSTQRPSLEELKIQENVIDLFINNPLQKTPITVHQNTPTPKQVFKDELELSESDISKSELSSSTSGKENATKIIATNFDHTVENTMSNGNHISFVLSYDSELLAQHFTNIEKDALSEVDWKELVEMKWESTLEPIHSWFELLLSKISNNGVNLIISRFNLMNNWIISEILLTANLEDRMLTISKFIHIAKHCQSLQNYATLLQIVLALNSTRISRLKSTWEGINAGDILILRSLEKITYPSKNFRNLRIELDKVTASKGCIPFIGIYLNDLIFNNERPSVIKKNVESSIQTKVKIINSLAEDDTELINISKFSLLSSIVKNLLQMIDWSKFYDFKTDKEILSKCLYIRSLSEKEMDYCFNCIAE